MRVFGWFYLVAFCVECSLSTALIIYHYSPLLLLLSSLSTINSGVLTLIAIYLAFHDYLQPKTLFLSVGGSTAAFWFFSFAVTAAVPFPSETPHSHADFVRLLDEYYRRVPWLEMTSFYVNVVGIAGGLYCLYRYAINDGSPPHWQPPPTQIEQIKIPDSFK